jgi:WD40 repeat protein
VAGSLEYTRRHTSQRSPFVDNGRGLAKGMHNVAFLVQCCMMTCAAQQSNDTDHDLLQLARTSKDFFVESEELISMSPTHVYYSALPLLAKDSPPFRIYSTALKDQIPTHTSVTFPKQRATELLTTGNTSDVTAITISPNEQRAVSGLRVRDGSIHMWGTAKGLLFGGVLRGHMDAVTSIAFSADGARLLSGSKDGNIWLWDGVRGAPLAQFPHYHTNIITTLAFSPDGTHVVSGSDDKIVRFHRCIDRRRSYRSFQLGSLRCILARREAHSLMFR